MFFFFFKYLIWWPGIWITDCSLPRIYVCEMHFLYISLSFSVFSNSTLSFYLSLAFPLFLFPSWRSIHYACLMHRLFTQVRAISTTGTFSGGGGGSSRIPAPVLDEESSLFFHHSHSTSFSYIHHHPLNLFFIVFKDNENRSKGLSMKN